MTAATLSDDRPQVVPEPPATLNERILDAVGRCVARWGVAKTTLDDIAREAGCSRATVYRAFPGGKDVVMAAAARREMALVADRLAVVLASGRDLTDTAARGLVAAVVEVRSHLGLQYLVQHEPGLVLPYVSFDGLDPLLEVATAFVAPYLARFLDEPEARHLAEVLARMVVSHAFGPSPFVDLTDLDDTRRYLDTYVLAGFTPTASGPVPPSTPDPDPASASSSRTRTIDLTS